MAQLTYIIPKRRGRSHLAPRRIRETQGFWFVPREIRFRSLSISRNFRREKFEPLKEVPRNRIALIDPDLDDMSGSRVGYGRIPDRWRSYDPYGRDIIDTRFVPFKCPLDKRFFSVHNEGREGRAKVFDDEEIFTIDVLLAAKRVQKRIGLVIDLTNTNRYYDPNDFINRGVKHIKIRCPGHEVDGREDIVGRFNKVVDDYLKENNDDSLIGVHCTHGINRTGYLIGRYLMEKEGWTADDFIKKFEYCRGHPIEREAYKTKLREVDAKKKLRTKPVSSSQSSNRKEKDEIEIKMKAEEEEEPQPEQ